MSQLLQINISARPPVYNSAVDILTENIYHTMLTLTINRAILCADDPSAFYEEVFPFLKKFNIRLKTARECTFSAN